MKMIYTTRLALTESQLAVFKGNKKVFDVCFMGKVIDNVVYDVTDQDITENEVRDILVDDYGYDYFIKVIEQ